MSFQRERLPGPKEYYECAGLTFRERKGKWRTTRCEFHEGSDSMRINTASGAFCCMACGVKGGDVLAYHMQAHGMEFIDAAKALGAWIDDGIAPRQHKPTALPPRAALEVLGFEATVCAVSAGNLANGLPLTERERERLLVCARRINRILEDFAS